MVRIYKEALFIINFCHQNNIYFAIAIMQAYHEDKLDILSGLRARTRPGRPIWKQVNMYMCIGSRALQACLLNHLLKVICLFYCSWSSSMIYKLFSFFSYTYYFTRKYIAQKLFIRNMSSKKQILTIGLQFNLYRNYYVKMSELHT